MIRFQHSGYYTEGTPTGAPCSRARLWTIHFLAARRHDWFDSRGIDLRGCILVAAMYVRTRRMSANMAHPNLSCASKEEQ